MRIAQLVSNYYSVPPQSSKAIFHMVHHLTSGLVERGNDVTLFGSGDSETTAKLVSVTDVQTSQMGVSEKMTAFYRHMLISECYRRAGEFDVIHSHFNVMSAFYAHLCPTPIVTTLHSPITDETRPVLERYRDLNYISFSHSQRKQMPQLNWIANVYHGIDVDKFAYTPAPDEGYWLFMGRLVEEKGAHVAIEAARAAGEKIVIAGRSGGGDYWHKRIEPFIDGKKVVYVGEANHEEKIGYFANAKALLFPVQWEEPFGLVMIEAMACGTPVIGFDRGSVSEIVQHEETGFIVKDVAGMVDAMERIDEIDRRACRDRVERLFSRAKMVEGYAHVYERVVDQHKRTKVRKK